MRRTGRRPERTALRGGKPSNRDQSDPGRPPWDLRAGIFGGGLLIGIAAIITAGVQVFGLVSETGESSSSPPQPSASSGAKNFDRDVSFLAELESVATVEPSDRTYADYSFVEVPGALRVEVPLEWSETEALSIDSSNRPVTGLYAAPSVAAFKEKGNWDAVGMLVIASSALARDTEEQALLDDFRGRLQPACDYDRRRPFIDRPYTGYYDTFINCGDRATTYVVVAARPPNVDYLILVQVQANEQRDLEALDRILESFLVLGEV